MKSITFKGEPVPIAEKIFSAGDQLPDVKVTTAVLEDRPVSAWLGKTLVLNMVPSFDTPVCAASAKRFYDELGKNENVHVLNISADLPFAQARFCSSASLENADFVSIFRFPEFGEQVGIGITGGPLKGLLSRAVWMIDAQGRIAYIQHVPEIAQEPDYDDVLNALKDL